MAVRRLTRRVLIESAAATLFVPPALGQSASSGAGLPQIGESRDAAAFAASIGVNTHLSSEPYASRFPLVKRLLAESGIRNLRDELRPTNDLARWRELYEQLSVRGQLLVSPFTNTPAEMLDYIAALGPEKLTAIEGQNEGDHDWFKAQKVSKGNWSKTVVDYQREIYKAIRTRYNAAALPVVSPTVLDWKPLDMQLLRAAAGYCDIVALHSYVQHSQEPETEEDYAALSWYLRHMRDTFKPGAPVMTTEVGYNNFQAGKGGIPEKAASIYIVRLLLNNFAAGVKRTFLYQLLDGPNPAEWEDNWGIVRYDGAPKPAFTAIAALIGAFAADGRPNPRIQHRVDLTLQEGRDHGSQSGERLEKPSNRRSATRGSDRRRGGAHSPLREAFP